MSEYVLQVTGLIKRFSRKGQTDVVAVDEVSFDIRPRECVGLVGGSGSGKSTIAKLVTGLLEPTSGSVLVGGHDVTHVRGAARRKLAQQIQMVFQDPVTSFDPRRRLGDGIAEGMRNFGTPKEEANEQVKRLLVRCGLPTVLAERYPREVSGGQCQRAAIARALALRPALIICDEATSALDVTVQAQIMELLRDVRTETGAAMLFICHDLALVQGFCDRIMVMRAGRIVESGPTDSVLMWPQHPYTAQLLDAVLA